MTADTFFDATRRGIYALISLTTGGLCAGGAMLLMSLLSGPYGVFIGIPALMIWPVGMVCVGGPVWAILHAQGRRSRKHARVAGGVGGALSVLAVAALLFGANGGVWLTLMLGVAGALSGVVGGGVVWSMAYGGRDGAGA